MSSTAANPLPSPALEEEYRKQKAAATGVDADADTDATSPASPHSPQTRDEKAGHHHHHRGKKGLAKGPNGEPNAAFLEKDPLFSSIPPSQLEALQAHLKRGGGSSMRSIIAAVVSAHRASVAAKAANGGSTPLSPTSRSPVDDAAAADVGLTATFVAPSSSSAGGADGSAAAADDAIAAATESYLQNLQVSTQRVNMASLIPKARQRNLKPLLFKTLRSAVMAFIYTGIGRLVLGLTKSLLRSGLAPKKFLKLARREFFTANPLKWGTVMAGMACYRLLQQLVLRLSPHMPVPISCAIGGGLASLPLMALNVETRTELGLYLGVRAIHGAICAQWDNIPMPESWRRYKDWTVIYMVFLAMEILYTFSFFPETHTPAYNNFVASNTKQHIDTMHCLAALVRRQYSPYMIKMYKLNGNNIVTPEFAQMAAEGCGGCVMKPGARIVNVNDLREACTFLHHYTPSCIYHYLHLSVRHFFTFSIPMYLPLKVSTTLLFGMKKVIKQPLVVARKVTVSVLTSSAFLTLYAVVPHLLLCLSSNTQNHNPFGTCALAGLCGFATYLEPAPRRIDLALYCSIHGFRSFVNLLHVKGLIPRPTSNWIFWLQTIAVGALFYQYDEHYDHIHSNVKAACGWVLKEKHSSAEDVAHALEWQAVQDAVKKAIGADGAGVMSSIVDIDRDDADVDDHKSNVGGGDGDAVEPKEEIDVDDK